MAGKSPSIDAWIMPSFLPHECPLVHALSGVHHDPKDQRIAELKAQVAALAEALQSISVSHPGCAENAAFVGSPAYIAGLADGHVCAAKIAKAALTPKVQALVEQRRLEREVVDAVAEELPKTILKEDEAYWFPRTRRGLDALRAAQEVPHA